ncbi:MAG: DUF177 domain-containing protein [Erysipelotrichaceae bacterium]|nr:DUF177 domain-containing protein [Erysipelotrichaceae bacterium]
MEIKLKDLKVIPDKRVYPVDIPCYEVKDNLFLRRLEDVKGEVSFYYDTADDLVIDYHVKGKMICPCAITLEDVEVPFSLQENDLVSFDESEEGFYLKGDMSIEELVYSIVFPEVPIKVVKKEKIEYSRGDGWSFLSEEEFRNEHIDPRLAILKELTFEEEEE